MSPAPSIPSGTKFSQMLVDQRPRFESKRMFRRKLRRGRPAQRQPRQYWVK